MKTLLLIAIGCLLLGCAQRQEEKTDFLIAAAADLSFAMDELAGMFQKQHPEIKVKVIYGSSGQFTMQIENGAPYDIFCSADLAFPRGLIAKGMALAGSEFSYAVGRIVIWVPSSSKIDVEKLGIQSLRLPTIRHIAIAHPDHAPYGRAAVAAMRSLGVYDAVKGKLAYGQNIAETLQYVQTGTADIGIVALALAMAPTVRETGKYWEFPIDTYPTMEQGGVILQSTKHPAMAQEFRDFMLTNRARDVLKSYGFYLPSD